MNHYVCVREDSPGRFLAHPCGMPEVVVSASTREEAIAGVTQRLCELLESGQLVSVRLPIVGQTRASTITNDEPMQRAYIEAIERSRQEELQRTLAEYEAECPPFSLTPTT